jgi:hypothetical protein
MFGSVGDDGKLLIWDLREKGDKPTYEVLKAHNGDVNCLSFNPKHEHMVATGGSDALVNIWDLRFLTSKLHECAAHKEGVFQVSWSPHSPNILGSCSSDRRLLIWDLSKIGAEQSPEDAQDGPPELLFVHGGHTAKVSDFSWNCSDPWTIASVAEDNILHIWQPTGTVYMPDGEGGSGAATRSRSSASRGRRRRRRPPAEHERSRGTVFQGTVSRSTVSQGAQTPPRQSSEPPQSSRFEQLSPRARWAQRPAVQSMSPQQSPAFSQRFPPETQHCLAPTPRLD